MCAIYGFLDYGKKIPHWTLTRLLQELSISAEVRGTDATGISYVNDGEMVTFKKATPAHKVKLFFPKNTTAVIGHNRMTTQGSELKNYNNHPFEGRTGGHTFALAHNGVLWNDVEIRQAYHLPETPIETDSYAAVQILEQSEKLDFASIKSMAETVFGSFVFTILRDDNTLFLVKGENPLTIYHYPKLGLYLYASTKEILNNALKCSDFSEHHEEILTNTGDIFCIDSAGNLTKSTFEITENLDWYDWYQPEQNDVDFLRSIGYTSEEIEEFLLDAELFEEVLDEAKTLFFA